MEAMKPVKTIKKGLGTLFFMSFTGFMSFMCAEPAFAQTRPPATPPPAAQPRRPPRPPRPPIGLRAYFIADVDFLRATRTFDAVLGSSQFIDVGGGVDLLGVLRNMFMRVDFTKGRRKGDRIAVFNGEVFPLNIPVTVSRTPIEIAVGWRFVPKPRTTPVPPAPGRPAPPPPQPVRPGAAPPARPKRYTPYIGGGVVLMHHAEKSDFAATGDNVSLNAAGFTLFGGVDIGLRRRAFMAIEGGFRGVPGAIGEAGASKEFGEKDLGGALVRFMIGIKR
jgi:hypothetical protein